MAELTSAELAEWRAYERVEPFGERRADLRMGITTAVLANIHRSKDREPYEPADFMPFGPPRDKSASLSDKIKAAFGKLPKSPDSK